MPRKDARKRGRNSSDWLPVASVAKLGRGAVRGNGHGGPKEVGLRMWAPPAGTTSVVQGQERLVLQVIVPVVSLKLELLHFVHPLDIGPHRVAIGTARAHLTSRSTARSGCRARCLCCPDDQNIAAEEAVLVAIPRSLAKQPCVL